MSDVLAQRAKALKLYGLLSHWEEVVLESWVKDLIDWEEEVRCERGLQRRMSGAKLGRFKPLSEFDWTWPKSCDRGMIEEWMSLLFVKEAINLILCGPNGVGKSTIACNIAHQAVLRGHTVLFTTAAEMLNELAALDSDSLLRRRIKYYAQPKLLFIDEVGYLSYSNRHADLFFEIISRRYEKQATIITTNKPFSEWRDIFPNAACVVSIIDRLVHHSQILNIEAESYRLKEAKERNQELMKGPKSKTKTSITTKEHPHDN